ncbi:MAG: hypothetical protein M3Y54_19215 [Bacteroidota bacterium]|nr:hypothetical protein [Bacteroidota bacterium]
MKGIIRHYRKWRKDNPDSWFDLCIEQTSLRDAIQVAARSVNARGIMSGHQCLVGAVKLGYWADYLAQFERKIHQVNTFKALYSLLENIRDTGKANAHIEGVGELLIYDTAHRIGGYRGLLPKEIHLHSGTRRGSRNLLGTLPRGKHWLPLSHFPSVFAEVQVTASELEDILCIYKDDFRRCLLSSDSQKIVRQPKC